MIVQADILDHSVMDERPDIVFLVKSLEKNDLTLVEITIKETKARKITRYTDVVNKFNVFHKIILITFHLVTSSYYLLDGAKGVKQHRKKSSRELKFFQIGMF